MKFIPNAVTTKAARTVLVSQKHSPQALFVGGLIGVGATVVLACKATLKVDSVLEEAEKDLFKIQELRSTPSADLVGQYSEKDAKKDKAIVYLRTTAHLSKLYGPAIICGTASVLALAGSHNLLTKRNAALAAAYGTLEKAFEGYRERVREAYGEEREQELYHDVQPCEIEDEKTGKKTKVKKANGGSPYSFLFDEFNKNWEPTPEYNFMFLKMQQQFANNQLQARGHLFLNEVLDSLGFEHTKAGAVTGWVKGHGDDFVDFGIFNKDNEERVVEFMIGREKAIWLDFNVDGVIYDKI
jgi:hypothetical protein